jgi:hypothetical protein
MENWQHSETSCRLFCWAGVYRRFLMMERVVCVCVDEERGLGVSGDENWGTHDAFAGGATMQGRMRRSGTSNASRAATQSERLVLEFPQQNARGATKPLGHDVGDPAKGRRGTFCKGRNAVSGRAPASGFRKNDVILRVWENASDGTSKERTLLFGFSLSRQAGD